MNAKLISTISKLEYPFSRIKETAENGEPLEVFIPGIEQAKILSGQTLGQRFKEFLPLPVNADLSQQEGNSPLKKADANLQRFTGVKNLLLKDETVNPTGSFKDRGSLLVTAMCREMRENITATISTGNMGSSISAYGKQAGLKTIVFIPTDTPAEKVRLMSQYGSIIFTVKAPDYSLMKREILALGAELGLRIVSGNGPIRVEGYKLTAFELYEQMQGEVPDYIAVPTSACGHIRGIFKGYRELFKAGLIQKLPRMIIVQAANNSPIVSAVKQGKEIIIPFRDFHTIAHAITSGKPYGGNEIIQKAKQFNWLAEDVTEKEIVEAQKLLQNSGYSVEPASATVLPAVRKLQAKGQIGPKDKVVAVLTGAGEKPIKSGKFQSKIISCQLPEVKQLLQDIISIRPA